MGDAGLVPLRQQDADPVARAQPLGRQHVGEAVRQAGQILETEEARLAIGIDLDQTRAAGILGHPAVEHGRADIEAFRYLPGEVACGGPRSGHGSISSLYRLSVASLAHATALAVNHKSGIIAASGAGCDPAFSAA